MNGPHDMGGMQCYGPVEPEVDEPVFHAEWEKRALALTLAMGLCGKWNIDISRHARERLRPDFYISSSYYKIWLAGLETLMLESGMVNQAELKSGFLELEPIKPDAIAKPETIGAILAKGGPSERKIAEGPKFKVGQRIKTRNLRPIGHSRLPGYARGKLGEIAAIHGSHVFPDSNAHAKGEDPHWLYSVMFDSTELFGEEAEPGGQVMIDCWEPYLDAA